MAAKSSPLLRLAPGLFVALWSTGWVVAGLSAPYADPLTFLTVRFALAGALMAVLVAVSRAPFPRTRAEAGHAMVSGVLLHALYLGSVYWAVAHGLPAGVSGILAALQPILTALLAPVLVGERIGPARWVGVALGFAGLLLVLEPRLEALRPGLGGASGWPLAINLGGMVSVTLGTFYQKRFVASGDLRTVTALQYCGAVVVTGVLALLLEPLRMDWNLQLGLAMAWSVLGLSIGAVGLLLLLIRRGAVSRAAVLIFLVPPAAAAETWLLLGESLRGVQVAGMVVTAAGVALASRRD